MAVSVNIHAASQFTIGWVTGEGKDFFRPELPGDQLIFYKDNRFFHAFQAC
jgi:hypothetical protein